MLQEILTRSEEHSLNDIIQNDYMQLSTEYHEESKSLWFYMQSEPRPCFTSPLLHDLQKLFIRIKSNEDSVVPLEYVVAASGVNGVYNLGGDLASFIQHIRAGSAEKLRSYAYSCLELGYQCYQQFNRDITSIALVEGNCYGGGFEAALSCNFLIAEESAQFCFPEISFNLFPGMGAYSYLTRRVSPHIAEKIITSGRVYTARELFDMGVIDQCVPNGEGHQATLDFISQHRRQRNGRNAMNKARQIVQVLSLEELKQVSDIWVDAALNLNERALRVMERFAHAQLNRRFTKRNIKMDNLVA
jgi:DSF synthase